MFCLISILPFVSATAGTGEAIIYSGLLITILVFLGLCFFIFINYNNLISRVFSFGFGYLLFIAISFISWNMANDFLTNTFLIAFFRIIFLVLMVGAFPLLIGSFAWYVIMLFRIKEIEKLMEKGFSFEDAETRVKNRRKRR